MAGDGDPLVVRRGPTGSRSLTGCLAAADVIMMC
jgi:hypothetical protein